MQTTWADPSALSPPISAWLRSAGPAGIAVVGGAIAPATSDDNAILAHLGCAVGTRRDEFATGRRFARAALAMLGCASCSIPVGRDREPIWPEGFVGSISHSRAICVAVVAPAAIAIGIGVDIEADDAIEPKLAREVASPQELLHLERQGASSAAARALCFSAKEAHFKATFPITRRFLSFHDVEMVATWSDRQYRILPTAPAHSPPQGPCYGRFEFLADHVVTLSWIEQNTVPNRS